MYYELMKENRMVDYTKAAKTYDNTRNSDDLILEIMFQKSVFDKDKNILDAAQEIICKKYLKIISVIVLAWNHQLE